MAGEGLGLGEEKVEEKENVRAEDKAWRQRNQKVALFCAWCYFQ